MKYSLYIFRDCNLRRKDNTLYIEPADGDNIYIPIKQIRDIYNIGNLSLNDKMLSLLNRENISLHFFNYYGNYIGSFQPSSHYNNSSLLIKQVEAYTDYSKRVFLAKKIVSSAVDEKLKFLKSYVRNNSEVNKLIDKIIYLRSKFTQVDKIPSLMAYEANIQKEYYKVFDLIIKNKDFVFTKRTKRPCKNEVNALISFTNSLLYSTVLSEINKTALDYRIAYVHTNNSRGYNLNLDIADIFKPAIVDKIIINSINLKIISKRDFTRNNNGVYLSKSGMKKIVEIYDKKLNETLKIDSKIHSYRYLIRKKLYELQSYLKID